MLNFVLYKSCNLNVVFTKILYKLYHIILIIDRNQQGTFKLIKILLCSSDAMYFLFDDIQLLHEEDSCSIIHAIFTMFSKFVIKSDWLIMSYIWALEKMAHPSVLNAKIRKLQVYRSEVIHNDRSKLRVFHDYKWVHLQNRQISKIKWSVLLCFYSNE